MYAVSNEEVYRLRFCYPEDDKGRRVTQCEVWRKVVVPDSEEPGEELVSIGRATCSKFDMFNKVVGRKVALTGAIAHLDKETRTAIWEVYKKHSKFVA